jgi:hypothetical protein
MGDCVQGALVVLGCVCFCLSSLTNSSSAAATSFSFASCIDILLQSPVVEFHYMLACDFTHAGTGCAKGGFVMMNGELSKLMGRACERWIW